MNTAIRSGAPVALLVLATACGNMTLPTAPTSTSRIYVSVQLGSRFVLHDDGTFALQYRASTSKIAERIRKPTMSSRSTGVVAGGSQQDRSATIPFRFGTATTCCIRTSTMVSISERGDDEDETCCSREWFRVGRRTSYSRRAT